MDSLSLSLSNSQVTKIFDPHKKIFIWKGEILEIEGSRKRKLYSCFILNHEILLRVDKYNWSTNKDCCDPDQGQLMSG